MTAAVPDIWQERCLVGLIPDGGSEIAFAGIMEDITSVDWGEKDIEGMATLSGGRLVGFTPMTDESITIKVWPVSAGIDSESTATGIAQLFHPQSTADSTEPIAVDNRIDRQKFGLILLWATTLPATAGAQNAAGTNAFRIQVINAYMTSYKPDYSDKRLSAEVTFKWTPVDKSGNRNKREESSTDGSQLPAGITTATSF